MYRHAEGLEFRFAGGLTAEGIPDRTAGELFEITIEHADIAGDHRLSSLGNDHETGLLQEQSRVSAQLLAGFTIVTAQLEPLPLAIRLEDAVDYGGFCVSASEIAILGDMVEWLDRRADVARTRLPSGSRASRIRSAVLPVLRREQDYFATNQGAALMSKVQSS